jgi:hypothetical protein
MIKKILITFILLDDYREDNGSFEFYFTTYFLKRIQIQKYLTKETFGFQSKGLCFNTEKKKL